VAGVGLIGLSPSASFEFHVSGWLSDAGDARYPTPAEVDRLGLPVVCFVGSEERHTACHGTRAQVVGLPGGHHFGGDYARLASELLTRVMQTGQLPKREGPR
jgi:type IV secretory pathway VirJ component